MSSILAWTVRADEVGDATKFLTFAAPQAAMPPLAKAIGVERVLSCEANVRLVARGQMVLASGRVHARIEQICGVSLEPFEAKIDEPIENRFAPEGKGSATPYEPEQEGSDGMADLPEPIVDGVIDLGALLLELLALGVDPYPRKPGVTFEPPASGDVPSPFAILRKAQGGEADDP